MEHHGDAACVSPSVRAGADGDEFAVDQKRILESSTSPWLAQLFSSTVEDKFEHTHAED